MDAKGKTLFTASQKGELRAWNVDKDRLLWKAERKGMFPISGLELGRKYLAYSTRIAGFSLIDVETGASFVEPLVDFFRRREARR